jgi:galactokinase
MIPTSTLQSVFIEKFGAGVAPRMFRSPARINLIGEHVDYLGGLVLPAAIQFSTFLAIRPTSNNTFRLYSQHFNSLLEINTIQFLKENTWGNYILGVLSELDQAGCSFSGFDLLIDGDIPQGAGLSSSASLEVGVGYALSECFQLGLSREKIALLAQKAENNFVGTKCGIMDQFIISVGKEDHCILLDTETLSYSYTSIHSGIHEFYLVNSNVKHSLENSPYNQRRRECESAFSKISQKYKDSKNLYSLPENEINFLDFSLTAEEIKRVKHVLGEKKRTQDILHAFSVGDLRLAGSILTQTHQSLSKLFEVSCSETDFLVDELLVQGVLGARMIGGGFGGCILVLDEKGKRNQVASHVKKKYSEKFSIDADFYSFQIANGVSELK